METTDANADGRIVSERDGHLRILTIDRPAKLNGFTPKMMRELAVALTDYDKEPETRCAILKAEGPHFTAGLDLPKVSEAWRRGESIYPADSLDVWDLRPPFRSKPLVVAVKGICFTVGVELMLSGDSVIAADNCRFAQLEVKRGIMAAGDATIRMVERTGWGNAMRYLLTGDEWDAETALRFNFVPEVVPAGQEYDRARALSLTIAERAAPLAVAATAPMPAPPWPKAPPRRSRISIASASGLERVKTRRRGCAVSSKSVPPASAVADRPICPWGSAVPIRGWPWAKPMSSSKIGAPRGSSASIGRRLATL
jgi:enoyl-CoA hydratase